MDPDIVRAVGLWIGALGSVVLAVIMIMFYMAVRRGNRKDNDHDDRWPS